ncbi:MAG: class I SAM-dependent methyltransferase [Burkholderiales bacterium]|nr:class I SAM-dependent methyltransferase [Burkholderiales bacterium]
MITYYSQRAAEYDRIYDIPERQPDIQELHRLCGAMFEGLDVLEVSCGTGYWTQSIASSAKSITASDINDSVLQIARNRTWSGTAVEFRQADSYALPDFDRRFNAAFSGFWWSHIPQNRIRDFLLGFHAHLAPNAPVVFIDNRYVEGSSTPISRIDENGDSFQIRKLGDGSSYEVLKNFPSKDELTAAIEGIAHSVKVNLLDYYWILSYQKK